MAQIPNKPIVLSDKDSDLFKAADLKLVFLDIDGTIVGSDGQISNKTKSAISRFQSLGGRVGLASGRPHFSAQWVIDELKINAPCLFYSGSLIVEPARNRVLHEVKLDASQIEPVVKFARENDIYVEAYTSDNYFIESPAHLTKVHEVYMKRAPPLGRFDELFNRSAILKLVLVTDSRQKELLIRDFAGSTKNISVGIGYGAAHPDVTFANITSLLANRHKAFEIIIKDLSLSARNVAAFGDAEADLPFLNLATYGVAMGNAPDPVRKLARYVTKSVEEDGVAYALNLMLQK